MTKGILSLSIAAAIALASLGILFQPPGPGKIAHESHRIVTG